MIWCEISCNLALNYVNEVLVLKLTQIFPRHIIKYKALSLSTKRQNRLASFWHNCITCLSQEQNAAKCPAQETEQEINLGIVI